MNKKEIFLSGVHNTTTIAEVQQEYTSGQVIALGANENGKKRFKITFQSEEAYQKALARFPKFHGVKAKVAPCEKKKKPQLVEEKEALEVTFPDDVCKQYYLKEGGVKELQKVAAKASLQVEVAITTGTLLVVGPKSKVSWFKKWLEGVHKTMSLNFYLPMNLKAKLTSACEKQHVAVDFKGSNGDQVLAFLYGKTADVAKLELEFASCNQQAFAKTDAIAEEPEDESLELETKEDAPSLDSDTSTPEESVPNTISEKVVLNFMAKAKPTLILQARKTCERFPQANVYVTCQQQHAIVNFSSASPLLADVKSYFFSIAEKRMVIQLNKQQFGMLSSTELQNIQFAQQCKIEKNSKEQKLIFTGKAESVKQAVNAVSTKYGLEEAFEMIPMSQSKAVFLAAMLKSSLCAQYKLPTIRDAQASSFGLTIKGKAKFVAAMQQKLASGLGIVEKLISIKLQDFKRAKFVVSWLTSKYGEKQVSANRACMFIQESPSLTKNVTIVAGSQEKMDEYEEFVKYFAVNACSFAYSISSFNKATWLQLDKEKAQFESTICEFVRNEEKQKLYINAYNGETLKTAMNLVEDILKYGEAMSNKIIVLEPFIFKLLQKEYGAQLVEKAKKENVLVDCSQTRDHRVVLSGAEAKVKQMVEHVRTVAGSIELQLKYDVIMVTQARHQILSGKYKAKVTAIEEQANTIVVFDRKQQIIPVVSGTFKKVSFKLMYGDITFSTCSALVNPSTKSLAKECYLSKLIAAQAGAEYEAECEKIRESAIALGSAVVTGAGDISPTKIIIHAIVPDWKHSDTHATKLKILATAVTSSLVAAESKEMDSVAFPVLYADNSGAFPISAGLEVIVDTIASYFQAKNQSCIRKIHFYTEKHAIAQEWKSAMHNILPVMHPLKIDMKWISILDSTAQSNTTVPIYIRGKPDMIEICKNLLNALQ